MFKHTKTKQVIYGHKATVTCIARSECNVAADFYVATGSLDCTVLLWHWSNKSQAITGDAGDSPCPKAVLTGHDTEIICAVLSAEHGIVISSSKCNNDADDFNSSRTSPSSSVGVQKSPSAAHLLTLSRDCYVVAAFDDGRLRLFTTSGRLLKTTKLEAPFT
uniref:Uncharacterized protein n=1 Tax=Romanomermis culicivorax TaxID=13658 RepID=A0A915KAW1_ROMCU